MYVLTKYKKSGTDGRKHGDEKITERDDLKQTTLGSNFYQLTHTHTHIDK